MFFVVHKIRPRYFSEHWEAIYNSFGSIHSRPLAKFALFILKLNNHKTKATCFILIGSVVSFFPQVDQIEFINMVRVKTIKILFCF